MGTNKWKIIDIIILSSIILLNILDFIEWLPGDIDFLKKVISWLVLGYLLYRLSLTKQFFGVRNSSIDLLLILSYFLLILKNLLVFASIAVEETSILAGFYRLLINNSILLQNTAFILGGIMLILLSAYMALRSNVKRPSLMEVIHEKGIPKTIYKRIWRFLAVFIALACFFIIVFNLAMEWLAMAVDASLLIVAIVFYTLTLFRHHHKKFHPDTFIYKIGDVGEEFYEKFISLFHSKKRIFLAVSGMLVLHLLTDVANFVIPYILGFHDIIYFGHLGQGHNSLYSLFSKDIVYVNTILGKFSIAWIYIFNIIAMLFLLFLPAYIWYRLFRRSGFKAYSIELSLFFTSLAVFLLSPIFRISPLRIKAISGVDFLTNSIFDKLILNPILVMAISFIIGITIFTISKSHRIKERLIALAIICIDIFFTFYISLFFISLVDYYKSAIPFFFGSQQYFFVFYFSLFFTITGLFFILGFILFLKETKKEFRCIR